MCILGALAKQDHRHNPTSYCMSATTLVGPTARQVRTPGVTKVHAGATWNSVSGW